MSERYPGGFITKNTPVTTQTSASGVWTLDQAMQATKAGNWPVNGPFYIEDVFSTYLYTGNGSTQTITNGIDLAGKGGMVWSKLRSTTSNPQLYDTARGVSKAITSDLPQAEFTASGVTAFNTTGYVVGSDGNVNLNNQAAVGWTFREQPKFFDIVTYTGNGTAGRVLLHNLGSVPGCVMVKTTSTSQNWLVYHRSLAGGIQTQNPCQVMYLNGTDAALNQGNGPTNATATTITLSDNWENSNGVSYVMYLFAHNAGGFGLTGTDNVISCGSYTGNGSTTGPVVTLGYEPQWVLIKNASDTSNWTLVDNMRGMAVLTSSSTALLYANLSNAEAVDRAAIPLATGFQINDNGSAVNTSGNTYIYIAIRRGPMKVPTTGTSVFRPITRAGTGADATISSSPVRPDFVLSKLISGSFGGAGAGVWDRLRGAGVALFTNTTQAEATHSTSLTAFLNASYTVGVDGATNAINAASQNYVNYAVTRAPGFFDEVCYTGTGSVQTLAHNLNVVPELMITKRRDSPTLGNWYTYSASLATSIALFLNDDGQGGSSVNFWNNTRPTATQFTIGSNCGQAGSPYVNYLFATCPGVSKVGSYTGTGTTLQINCGFTAGSRFVMIKRTDSTGDWYVWDSARGIVAGNDPYFWLNDSAGDVTGTDYVDTFSAGFEITSTAPAAINANGGTFIFLAIA